MGTIFIFENPVSDPYFQQACMALSNKEACSAYGITWGHQEGLLTQLRPDCILFIGRARVACIIAMQEMLANEQVEGKRKGKAWMKPELVLWLPCADEIPAGLPEGIRCILGPQDAAALAAAVLGT